MISSLGWELLGGRTGALLLPLPLQMLWANLSACRVSSYGPKAGPIVNNLGEGLPFLKSYRSGLKPPVSWCCLPARGLHFLKEGLACEQQGNLEGEFPRSQVW